MTTYLVYILIKESRKILIKLKDMSQDIVWKKKHIGNSSFLVKIVVRVK